MNGTKLKGKIGRIQPPHKKYALLDDGTIEPLYYDVNAPLDYDNLRWIETEDDGRKPCLYHDKWIAGGCALYVNAIIKEADTIEELEEYKRENNNVQESNWNTN